MDHPVFDFAPKQSPLRLTRAGGCEIHVTAGIVWITAEACGHDVFLRPGGSFPIVGEGLVLVESVGASPATIVLHTPGWGLLARWRRLTAMVRLGGRDRMRGVPPAAAADTA